MNRSTLDEDATLIPSSGVNLSFPSTGFLMCGRYLLEERIGQGAAAVVHRATDTLLKMSVAVKILKTGALSQGSLAAGIGIDLRNEAIAAMRLSHPHILRVYNYEADDRWECLVMERVNGEDSRKHRRRAPGGCLPVEQTVQIGMQCLHALHYAHGLDVVHHDIKPSNILLTPTGDAKLCDFGLARLSSTRWKNGVVAGTPGFLSPERMSGRAGDHRSDLFSMGATLHALANGRAPFGIDPLEVDRALVEGRTPPRGRLPEPVHRVLVRSLKRQPADRFADAQEMRLELAKACEEAGIPVFDPSWDSPTSSSEFSPDTGVEEFELIEVGPNEAESEYLDFEISVCPAPPPPARPLASFQAKRIESAPPAPPGMVRIPGWVLQAVRDGRKVEVEGFFMDALLVTNADYSLFVHELARTPPPHWNGWRPPPDRLDHPVVGVTLEDAEAYASWVGKQLPTSLQWESACRSPDGRAYPWGNEWDARHCHCREGGATDTLPVGSYPGGASNEGCLDLVGLVWEWTTSRPGEGGDANSAWVCGGSYRHTCRTSQGFARNEVASGNDYDYLGFRCAQSMGS